jgi:hypothetical protein
MGLVLVYKREVQHKKNHCLFWLSKDLGQNKRESCLSFKGPDLQMGFGQNKGKVKQQNWVIKEKKGRCGDIWVQSKGFSEKWVTRPHDSLEKKEKKIIA